MSTNSSTHPSTGPSTKETNRQRSPRSDNSASTCCTFTFADGRQCRIPRRQGHPYLCVFHAKKEAQALAGEQAGRDIASFLSGDYTSSPPPGNTTQPKTAANPVTPLPSTLHAFAEIVSQSAASAPTPGRPTPSQRASYAHSE